MNTRRGKGSNNQHRSTGGRQQRQSKIRRKTLGEIRLKRLIELAEYELNVDPYRGMMISPRQGTYCGVKNPWHKCQWNHCSKTIPQDMDAVDEFNNIITSSLKSQCPSLISWTEQAQTLKLREEKRRGNKRKRSNNDNSKTAEHGGKSETTLADNIVCVGERLENTSFRCICDYNPFCLSSLGGAVDEMVFFVAQSTSDRQREEDMNENMDEEEKDSLEIKADAATSVENSQSGMSEIIDVDSESDKNLSQNKTTKTDSYDGMHDEEQGFSGYHSDGHHSGRDNSGGYNSDQEDQPNDCVYDAGSVYLEEPECEMEFDPEKDTAVYSKATAEQLICLRRSAPVEIESICSHIKKRIIKILDEGTDSTGDSLNLNFFLQKLRQWHESLLFSNPLQPADSSTSPIGDNLQLAIPPGIRNLGATCYLNSQLQCLAQNLAFLKGIFSWREPSADDKNSNRHERMHLVLSEMQQLLARMVHGAECTVTTNAFSNALGIEHGEMQDPNEFARLLLERMHETFQQCADEGTEVAQDLANLLPSIFHGVTTYETTCLSCQNLSKRNESFMDLNLQIVPLAGDKKTWRGADSDVQDCLDSYTRAELMDGENQYWCDECQKKQDASRVVKFSQLPPVLNVQLSRYVFDREKFVKKKLRDKVLLPEILYVPRGQDNLEETRESPVGSETSASASGQARYFLCAVLKHQGTSAYRGHYISQAMNWQTGKWYEFNDERVDILDEGPSSSYDPSVPHGGKSSVSSSKSNDKLFKVEGCSDAYNMYYVEASYFATCVKDDVVENRVEKPEDNGKIDLSEKMCIERGERYSLLSQMCMNDANTARRLERRRAGIIEYMFQKQISNPFGGFESEKEWRSSVWVDGDVLRRFLSCKDGLENLLHNPRGVPLLRHKHLLCCHGSGLHPRVARSGKLLPRQLYDVYVSLLLGEQNMLMSTNLSGQTESPLRRHEDVNDCVITPECNLCCSICAESYTKELAKKIENSKKIMELYELIDPQNDYDNEEAALESDDPIKNEANQYMYVVSRKFISSFRSAVSEILKKTDTSAGGQVSTDKGDTVSWYEGLDAVDFSQCFPGLTTAETLKSNESVDIDQSVNGSITCEHGKCKVANNKRVVRHVPWKVWSLIKTIFPKAICHSRKRNGVMASVDCSECAAKLREEREKHEEAANAILAQKADRKKEGANGGNDKERHAVECNLGPEDLSEDLQAETKHEDPLGTFPLQVLEVKPGSSVESALDELAQNRPEAVRAEETLRRSSRRRKTKYPAGPFLSEDIIDIRYDHNLAALRLFLYEKCPGFPIDQKLALVLPHDGECSTDHDNKSSEAGGANVQERCIEVVDVDTDKGLDVDRESTKVKGLPTFPGVIVLPYGWNQRTLQDVLQTNNAWDAANNNIPIILRLPAVGEKGGRQEKIARREQNEVLMDALLEVANISHASQSNSKQEKCKKSGVERGFRGTLLHTSLDGETKENLDEENKKDEDCDKEQKLPPGQIATVDKKSELAAVSSERNTDTSLTKPNPDKSKAGLVVILDESDGVEIPCPTTSQRMNGGSGSKQRESSEKPDGTLSSPFDLDEDTEKNTENPVRSQENTQDLVDDGPGSLPLSPNLENFRRKRRKDALAEAKMTHELQLSLKESLGHQPNEARCREAIRSARQQHPDASIEELKNCAFLEFL